MWAEGAALPHPQFLLVESLDASNGEKGGRVPLSLDYTKRLLARLDLEKAPEEVLDCPSYWDDTPCDLYFEACEELVYRDPKAALKAAEIAPRLATAVPEEDSPDGRRKHRDLLVRAHGILGSAFRSLGRHAEAWQSLNRASRLARKTISAQASTLLYRRLAYLAAAENKLDEALALAKKAKDVSDSQNDLGAGFTVRGYVRVKLGLYSDAVRDFGKALSIIDPKRDPGKGEPKRMRYAAVHNLLYAIAQNPSPESLGDLRFYLREARKLVPAHRRSLPRYQLYWIEGLILLKLGSGRRGERLLHRAQAGFLEIGACFETALIGLDISEIYRDEGRWGELEELASETFRQFEALSADAEAIAALKLWKEAIKGEKLEDKLLSEVGATLAARMRGNVVLA